MATPAVKRKATELAGSASKKPMTNASITSFFGAPKSSPTAPSSSNPASKGATDGSPRSSPPLADQAPSSVNTVSAFSTLTNPTTSSNFNKEKWVEKLTQEQKDLLAIEIMSLHESWLAVLKDEVLSKDFLDLKRFLKKEREAGKQIFPPAEDLYSWFISQFPPFPLSLYILY